MAAKSLRRNTRRFPAHRGDGQVNLEECRIISLDFAGESEHIVSLERARWRAAVSFLLGARKNEKKPAEEAGRDWTADVEHDVLFLAKLLELETADRIVEFVGITVRSPDDLIRSLEAAVTLVEDESVDRFPIMLAHRARTNQYFHVSLLLED